MIKVVYSLLSRFGGRWKKIKNKPYSLSSKTNRKPSIKEKPLSKFSLLIFFSSLAFYILYLIIHSNVISTLLFQLLGKIVHLFSTPNPFTFFFGIISVAYVAFIFSAPFNLRHCDRILAMFVLYHSISSITILILGLLKLLSFIHLLLTICGLLIFSILIRILYAKDDRYSIIKFIHNVLKSIITFKRKVVLVIVTITICVVLVLAFYDILMPDLG